MRIAYLSIGRHIHTERWLAYFAGQGHDVHLLTVQPGPMAGITVHDIRSSFGPKPVRYAASLLKVRRLLRDLSPDLLHTHFLTGYGYWGLFSGFRPFMLTVWGDDVYVTPHETPLKNWLARQALRAADWVTGDSRDIVDACIRLGSDPARSQVVQWGVDFEKFHPGITGPVRERLGIPAGAPVVLSTRSFTQPYYNIDVVIDTIASVRERFPDVVYIVAGNEGEDTRIRARALERGVIDSCRFVGRIPHADLPAWLCAAQVFVTIPSVDATAVSLLEAMATGSAIVATNLPSAAEWIVDGVSGRVVAPRDVAGTAGAIGDLLADPAARATYGRKAVEIVRASADHVTNMEEVGRIYRRLIEERRARPGNRHPA